LPLLSALLVHNNLKKNVFQGAIDQFLAKISASGTSIMVYSADFSPVLEDMIYQNNYLASSIKTDSTRYITDTTKAGIDTRAAAVEKAKAAAAVKVATQNLQKAKTDKTLQGNLAAANAALAKANTDATNAAAEWTLTKNQSSNLQILRGQRTTELSTFSAIQALEKSWSANLTKIENDLNTYAATLN
jgi:hypothetical protein